MAGQDLTGLNSILKEWYVTPMAEQVNQDVLVTQLLSITAENLEGLKAVLPLHYGRSSGIGARAEGSALPASGAQKYTRAEFDLKYHYARVQVSGPSIQRTKSDRGAFLQAMKSELDFIRQDLMLDQARQFYGNGDGVIGVVSSVSTVTVTLTSAEPITKGYLYIGGVYSLGAPATPTDILDGVAIVDVNPATPAVVFASSAAGASAADVIIRKLNVSDTTDISTVNEIDSGLGRIISATAVVGGIDPAATGKSFWAASTTDKVATPDISLDMLQVKANELDNAGGADRVVITTPGLMRRLFNSPEFKDNVRFVNSTSLKGGFESLSFAAGSGSMTLNADRLAPWTTTPSRLSCSATATWVARAATPAVRSTT